MLKEGQRVAGVVFGGGDELLVGSDSNIIDEIVCHYEGGQMGAVAWLYSYSEGELQSQWNVALLEGVFHI